MGFQQITRNSSKMKVFVIFALIAVAASAPADEWSNFKKTYNKVYRSYEEEQFRKSVFAETLAFINEHNAKYEQGLYTFDTTPSSLLDITGPEANPTGLLRTPGAAAGETMDTLRCDTTSTSATSRDTQTTLLYRDAH